MDYVYVMRNVIERESRAFSVFKLLFCYLVVAYEKVPRLTAYAAEILSVVYPDSTVFVFSLLDYVCAFHRKSGADLPFVSASHQMQVAKFFALF